MSRVRRKPKRCPICGMVFTPHHWNQVYCSQACKRKANIQAAVRANERLRVAGRYVVVHDPLPAVEGGFAPGVVFDNRETQAMLRVRSFTPGTLLQRVSDGSVWEVVVDSEGAQVLRPAAVVEAAA